MTLTRSIVSLACAGSLAPAVPAFAQGAAEFEAADLQSPYTGMRVSAGFGYRAKGDIDGGGEFGETALSIRGGPSFGFGDDIRLHAMTSYRFSHYDFSGFAVDPWENIHTFRFTPVVNFTINDRWSFYGGPTVAFSAEEGADFGDSFTGGGLAAVSYKVNDRLSVGGGLGVFSQIEDHARVAPILTANWQFHDAWNLRIGFSEVAASGGIGAEVTYEPNPHWKIGAGLQFQKKRFRLDENGPVPSGVGEDKSLPIYVRIGWQVTDRTLLEVLAGIAAGGKVRLEDRNGNELAERDYDPSALIGFRAAFNF